MIIEVQETIQGSKDRVWPIITDIENSPNVISGIDEVEILEKPAQGLVGLKWRETRTLFGKTAIETMWITDVADHESYATRAESHGAVYTTHITISEQNNDTVLTMTFGAAPQTLGAKIMYATLGRMFKNATIKALQQDLVDIKAVVESPEKV